MNENQEPANLADVQNFVTEESQDPYAEGVDVDPGQAPMLDDQGNPVPAPMQEDGMEEPVQQEPEQQPAESEQTGEEELPPIQNNNPQEAQLAQMNQQMQALMQQNQQLQQLLQQSQETNKQAVTDEYITPRIPPDQQARINEQFTERFYADPVGALVSMIQENPNVVDAIKGISAGTVEEKFAPLESKQRWDTAFSKFCNDPQHEGFRDMGGDIVNILEREMPELKNDQDPESSLEKAYRIASAQRLAQQARNAAPPKTEEDYLKDDAFIQKILSNPDIQKKFQLQQIQNVKDNQQVPAMSSSNGIQNSAPYIKNEPKSLDEAREIALQELSRKQSY